jgi:hypothetical protein
MEYLVQALLNSESIDFDKTIGYLSILSKYKKNNPCIAKGS